MNETRSRLGKRSRRKGKAFELDIVHELRKVWPAAKRGIGQARSGGDVPDIDGTPWWVECKHRNRAPNIPAALAQAVAAAKEAGSPRPPLAITRANGQPIIVSLRLDDFLAVAAGPSPAVAGAAPGTGGGGDGTGG